MNVTIGTQELAINSINDLRLAQNKLLEVFAESLMGTKESIRAEMEKDIMSHIPCFSNIQELTDWLDEMGRIEILGLYEEEIKDVIIRDALAMTDYDSIDEMQDAIEGYQDALSSIQANINNIQDNINDIQDTLDVRI